MYSVGLALRNLSIKKTASAWARRRVKKNSEPTQRVCPLKTLPPSPLGREHDGLGGDEDFSWVMLEPVAVASSSSAVAAAEA